MKNINNKDKDIDIFINLSRVSGRKLAAAYFKSSKYWFLRFGELLFALHSHSFANEQDFLHLGLGRNYIVNVQY